MATAEGNWPHDGTTSAAKTHCGTDGSETLSGAIIEAVATAKGVDPTDSDLGLYGSVDLEALDKLFERQSGAEDWRFEFSTGDYLVVVEGRGTVTVRER